jgi:cytochrome c oxidase subunit II
MHLRYVLPLLVTCMLAPFAPHSAVLATDAAPHRVEVTAKRFAYQPAEVTLKAGQPVVIEVSSADVPHGLSFKELNLDAMVAKGKPGEMAFTPTQVGDFVGHCSVFCGAGHGSMTLTLHVVK